MAYAIVDARWPLVVARSTEYTDDVAALDPSYRALEVILAREQPFVLMFDMRGATSTSSRRRRLMEWCDRHADALTRLIVAGAVVAASSVERGFVTAALWVRSPPWPMRVFADPSEAAEWLLAEYEQRSIASAR
jgi:hypothetical protein